MKRWHGRSAGLVAFFTTWATDCMVYKGRGAEEWERIEIPPGRYVIIIRPELEGTQLWAMSVLYTGQLSLKYKFRRGDDNRSCFVCTTSGPNNEHRYFSLSLPGDQTPWEDVVLAPKIVHDWGQTYQKIKIGGEVCDFFFNLGHTWHEEFLSRLGEVQLWVTDNRAKALERVAKELSRVGMGQCEATTSAGTILSTITA